MQKKSNKIELLAPAGSPEKMEYAFAFGADAVYAGIPETSMRARINKFDQESLAKAIDFAHKNGKKFYVTLNIYAHARHLPIIEKHFDLLVGLKPDAVIVADPGVSSLAKEKLAETGIEIHVSTQANATNWRAAKFWHEQGASRVILAREVTLPEIKEIHENVPEVELEYFVHGAMCMSYSGRCLLSKWMMGRSANLGDCVQPCRWGYKQKSEIKKFDGSQFLTMEIEEAKGRHGLELEEDNHGTYFFNSKDLNLIEYLPELFSAGVTSFKIEGRNKSPYYLAVVVRAYRRVIDVLEKGEDAKKIKEAVKQGKAELDELMHRGYTKGFLLENEPEHNFDATHEQARHQFVGEVVAAKGNKLTIKAHNAFFAKDEMEAVTPNGNFKIKVERILNEEGVEVESAHGGHEKKYEVSVDKENVREYSLLRKSL